MQHIKEFFHNAGHSDLGKCGTAGILGQDSCHHLGRTKKSKSALLPRLLLFAVALMALGFAGCDEQSHNEGKIEGTSWANEPYKYRGKSIPAGGLRLEFGVDDSVTYRIADRVFVGKYRLKGRWSVHFTFDKHAFGKENLKAVFRIDGDKATLLDWAGTKIPYSRVRER
jgi:hypothetical protein